ncbi:MAG: EamA family transporter, partial [Bacteroidetes bacterium]|nr:EamA family transporter [Bacteroidota bacterium]
KLPAEISSIYAYINPIVAILLGALLFEETLNIAIAIGGTITLSGLFMVNKSIRRTRRLAILNENQKETLDPLIS